jgi:endonuclease/exonuclease/phosphatase family metal-dependent hydrolase
MTIRVLTANLWGLPWPVSRDRVGRKMRFGELLARLSPDVVGLQEVWWPWRSRFPVSPLHVPRSWRDAGLALSGHLARDSRVDLLPFRHHRGADCLKRKGILHSAVRAGDTELRVIVTHFQAGRRHEAIRLRQAQALRTLVERIKEPVVCLGDFNFYGGHDGEAAELLARAGLRDAALATGNASPTFWSRGELERFDRIYVRHGEAACLRLQSVTVETGKDNPWSDHAPVSAVLEVIG